MYKPETVALSAALAATTASLCVALTLCKRKKQNRTHKAAKHTRQALLAANSDIVTTPWQQISRNGTNADFIAATNFDKPTFYQKLLPLFNQQRPLCNFGGPYRKGNDKRGRKAQLDSEALLALALYHMKNSTTTAQMSTFFGVVPSSVSVWLDYALVVLLGALRRENATDFAVKWPTVDEMKASASLLERNRTFGPLLKGVFGITDGGRFRCQNYGDDDLQNAFYEGYTQQEEVTNLFVFNFFGEIIHAAINFPGSWHDTKLAGVSGLYYPKLSDEITPPGMAILGDSAFVNNSNCTNAKILRARKSNETSDIPESAELSAIDMIMQRVMPSERQSAEWGIRAIKGPFQRLKTVLPADSKRRGIIIELAVRLLNGRTRLMGRNHIASTYSPSS